MRVYLAAIMLASLTGCGGMSVHPGEQVHKRREIPPGEGLFSGPSGEFVIMRGRRETREPRADKEEQSSR